MDEILYIDESLYLFNNKELDEMLNEDFPFKINYTEALYDFETMINRWIQKRAKFENKQKILAEKIEEVKRKKFRR